MKKGISLPLFLMVLAVLSCNLPDIGSDNGTQTETDTGTEVTRAHEDEQYVDDEPGSVITSAPTDSVTEEPVVTDEPTEEPEVEPSSDDEPPPPPPPHAMIVISPKTITVKK